MSPLRLVMEVFVGLIVIVAIFGFSGNIDFFIVSIVCTAGVSVVIWAPLALLTGKGIFKLLELLGWDVFPAVTSVDRPKISNEETSLVNYIEKARKHGFSDERIASFLRDQGWSADDITKAFSRSHWARP